MESLMLRPHETHGILITFCGLDGCGKSTMIRMLTDELQARGYEVLLTKQPTEEMRKSQIFRTYMDSEDHSAYAYRALSLMAAADRIQHTRGVIMQALQAGKIVISDRYFYSCLANLRARGYGGDRWIYEIAEDHIPAPNLPFFLDTSVETAVARVRSRPEERDRYIDMNLQYALCEEYRRICRENGGILISTDQAVEETYGMVQQHVNRILGGNEHE